MWGESLLSRIRTLDDLYVSMHEVIKRCLMNRIIFALFVCVLVTPSWASEDCKEQATMAVDLREDYKSYDEFKGDALRQAATLDVLRGAGVDTASIEAKLKQQVLSAKMVFLHSSGAKGQALYKKIYNSCVQYEKSILDRAAKQEAREAARAAAKEGAKSKD
jgi:hypothetical protein